MKTKIINTMVNSRGDVKLISSNKNMKDKMYFLYKILNKEVETEYVKLKEYKRNFGTPTYIFEFWGFDTFEEAVYEDIQLNEINKIEKKINNLKEINKDDIEMYEKEESEFNKMLNSIQFDDIDLLLAS